MKMRFLTLLMTVFFAVPATAKGLKTKQSPHSVIETVERFEAAAKSKGMKVFPRIDHSTAAKGVDQTMPPTIVVSVGNPKYGTKFMLKNPLAAIDFPPKAVVYQDKDGKVWISYNTSDYLYRTIFERHGLKYPEGDVAFYEKLLEELTDAATAPKKAG
ncbi:MAG: DUF302 domain-containing protein [Pseudomonadota bacterium]